MSEKNFPHSKLFKVLLSIVASILFVFIGIMLFRNANSYELNPIWVKSLGVITILFFGGLLFLQTKKLIRKA